MFNCKILLIFNFLNFGFQ